MAARALLELLMESSGQATGLLEDMYDHESSVLFRHIGEHPVEGNLMCLLFVYLFGLFHLGTHPYHIKHYLYINITH